jgi:hypothetical protein
MLNTGQNTSYTATLVKIMITIINAPSFTNNGNGTITDTVTGLMATSRWCEMTIESAYAYADNLVLWRVFGLRLPTPRESFSILNHQNTNLL